MVSKDYAELNRRKAVRAVCLAEQYPASAEVLSFANRLLLFQSEVRVQACELSDLQKFREPLFQLINEVGTDVLRATTDDMDEPILQQKINDYLECIDTTSTESFFARVLLQPFIFGRDIDENKLPPFSKASASNSVRTGASEPRAAEVGGRESSCNNRCPQCGHAPQVAVLQSQGHGKAQSMVCSLCMHQWSYPRGQCASCSQQDSTKLLYFNTPELGHVTIQVCTQCNHYLQCVDIEIDRQAIPDIDELVALPLDVWAVQQGYQKIQPNLAGI